MAASGLIPILYHKDVEVLMRAVDGCVAGGSQIFEMTNRGDGAFRAFEELLKRCEKKYPQLILGAGSIEDPHTAAIYLALGANFVVSPLLSEPMIRFSNQRKVAVIPGAGSVTEIAAAEELGCELVKAFPADGMGGPGFVKALLGPRPWSSIVPTSGVEPTEDNIRAWFQAGVAALGMGSKLFNIKRLEEGEDPELAKRVASVLAWIKAARQKPA
ncbi:MAG: bifunctional 4-hydroxy-2-oxoglutarate aldolase/2-dehydro-3-deoxy-phosphogluconate aldolase [Planctomycetes bacterium]|nr:bifunctional 4-hydroxy-2-oxoglutarate aldolase/2-dehydro-3-deoxy-phosphogluconate aldolase [Planctomycetota bacterium]